MPIMCWWTICAAPASLLPSIGALCLVSRLCISGPAALLPILFIGRVFPAGLLDGLALDDVALAGSLENASCSRSLLGTLDLPFDGREACNHGQQRKQQRSTKLKINLVTSCAGDV